MAQDHSGVNTHGLPRRDVARQQRHSHQQNRHAYKRRRIGRADSIKQSPHQTRQRQCRSETNCRTQACELRSLL